MSLVCPPPVHHLIGTVRGLRRVVADFGLDPARATAIEAFVNRPDALPRRVPPSLQTFKHDLYLAVSRDGLRIGIATSDRFEGIGLRIPAARLYDALGIDFAPVAQLHDRHGGPGSSLVISAELTGDRPLLKAYVQEDAWGAGLCTVADLPPPLADLHHHLPGDARVGVVSVKQGSDRTTWRAYLGARSAADLKRCLPDVAGALPIEADTPWGHYYATIRLSPDGPPTWALNKVYNTIQLGFGAQVPQLDTVWGEVEDLFGGHGRGALLHRFHRCFGGLRVVPTAIAHDGADVTDLYVAAWSLPSD